MLPARAPSGGVARVLWAAVMAFLGLLLAGMILIPGRSGASGAGALATVLAKVDQLIVALVSPKPLFEPRA